MIVRYFFIYCGLLCTSVALADSGFRDFLPVAKDRDLYVDYRQAERGEPTVVFLNGLTYDTTTWDQFAALLCGRSRGCLRYDMEGQGRSLSRSNRLLRSIPVELQVRDLKELIRKLKIQSPIELLGLSYGGGIGIAYASTFPHDVENLILISPFTRPIKAQDEWIRSQVRWTRFLQPWNPATDDELYDFYLKELIYSQYPLAEPVLLSHPLRLEAAFLMTQGIRKFRVEDYLDALPRGSVHLVDPLDDEYIDRDAYNSFWRALKPETQLSRLQVIAGKHKLPEQVPEFLASWVTLILNGNRWLREGRVFLGNYFLNKAKATDIEIDLNIQQEPQP